MDKPKIFTLKKVVREGNQAVKKDKLKPVKPKEGMFRRAGQAVNRFIWSVGMAVILAYCLALGMGKADFQIYWLANNQWYYTDIMKATDPTIAPKVQKKKEPAKNAPAKDKS